LTKEPGPGDRSLDSSRRCTTMSIKILGVCVAAAIPHRPQASQKVRGKTVALGLLARSGPCSTGDSNRRSDRIGLIASGWFSSGVQGLELALTPHTNLGPGALERIFVCNCPRPGLATRSFQPTVAVAGAEPGQCFPGRCLSRHVFRHPGRCFSCRDN
jgi:hypothetical protein